MNYRHLHYFWVVATEGSMARAAERLAVAVQTISQQVKELERDLGVALFKPEGRGLALTEAGKLAMQKADEIFRLGEALPEIVREAIQRPSVRLAVGLADGLPKLLVHQLLQPVLAEPQLRLQCFEESADELLAMLALHKLDVVLVDHVPAPNPNLKLYAHALGGAAGVGWYATPALAERLRAGFPASLSDTPVLLPSHYSVLRGQLDRWFERHGLRPRIVGEFEDSALLRTFAAAGVGVLPADERVHEELTERDGLAYIGPADGITETVYAISTEKKVQHPLVELLVQGTGPKTA